MVKVKKLDELQLIKRGKIFQRCLFIVIALLLGNVALIEFDIIFMSQRNLLLCVIMFTVAIFSIQMIWNDIYPIGEKRLRVVYGLIGLLGAALIGNGFYEAIANGMFEDGGLINDAGVCAIFGIVALSIPVTYLCRLIYNKKRGEGLS